MKPSFLATIEDDFPLAPVSWSVTSILTSFPFVSCLILPTSRNAEQRNSSVFTPLTACLPTQLWVRELGH